MRPNDAIENLVAQRRRFRAFLISRLRSEDDADDVLQNGLVKALERAGDVRDDEKLTAWFFQILRRTLIDHIRRRRAAADREASWMTCETVAADREAERTLCGCFVGLLGNLKPREAELWRRVELQGEPVALVAASLGLTANNASVMLHRARRALRQQLRQFCGDCARGACLDCDCVPKSEKPAVLRPTEK